MKQQRNTRTLAIIACGLGTRVALFTGNNYIPKLLLNIGGKTILAKILEAEDKFDAIAIALSTQRHIDMVKQWIESNLGKDVAQKCLFVLHEKSDGSANAIATTLQQISNIVGSSDVLLHWCDIYAPMLSNLVEGFFSIPDTDVCAGVFDELSDKHLYLDDANNRVVRYHDIQNLKKHGIIAQSASRTLFGIYAIPQALIDKAIEKCLNTSNLDFAKVMCQIGTVDYLVVCQKLLIEKHGNIEIYGDTESYLDKCDKHVKEKEVRYFNSIEIKDDVVVKTALCDRGYKLMDNEVEWYQICAGNGIVSNVPKVFEIGEHSFTMTKINGMTVKEYIDAFDKDCQCMPLAIGLLDMFDKQICSKLHAMQCWPQNIIKDVPVEDKLNAMLKEYVQTTVSRYDEISELVKDINVYNGELLPDFNELIVDIEDTIRKTAKDTAFCFLHGDPHVCNMMIDDEGTTLTCIDPRGYFGDGTYKKVGDADYDIAKFAFGLNGNSNFARASFHTLKQIDKHNGKLQLIANVRGYDIDKLPLTNRQKFLVGLCWFKFPAWLKNNPVEAIITYCHGALMTRQYLDAWRAEL